MDCKTARLLVGMNWPADEVAGTDAAALDAHLATCPRCADSARVERDFDTTLRARRDDVPIPAGLSDRLVANLLREQSLVFRRRVWRGTAAAAAAVALLVGGWSLLPGPAPLDVSAVAAVLDVENRVALVEAFRRDYNVETTAPADDAFDYRLMTGFGVGRLQGKAVPKIVFSRGPGQKAEVYVVRKGTFDAASEQPGEPHVGSPYSVQVIAADDPRFVFVVRYTVNDLRIFRPGGAIA